MTDLLSYCEQLAEDARAASWQLATASGATKNQWLQASAAALIEQGEALIVANRKDVAYATETGMAPASIDRLKLTPSRIAQAAEGLRQIAALPDPVGQVREGSVRPNGLQVRKVGVPLGVIFFIYESRPNVTVDAAGLCLKSGNAVLLRGGKESMHSNQALHQILRAQLLKFGLPEAAVQMVSTPEREVVGHLLKMNQYIDLVIPRGGESLIRRVAAEATMPVLKHYNGICHIYVDAHADYEMAERIIINAKCQRPGVCNALESILIHADVAHEFLPKLGLALHDQGVAIRGCPITCRHIPQASQAVESDYSTEYLDLIVSMKVIPDIDAAFRHIQRYGSKHTDAIITENYSAAQRFVHTVDSSAVLVNASTRFNDGFELGLGAEVGISTDKFHARGPCGLQELTTYKYVVLGSGQIRG